MNPHTLETLWRDPANWKAGVIYYCRQDPRIIVPKRVRWSGWTINFARPSAIPVLIGMIAYLTAPLTWLALHGYVGKAPWWLTIIGLSTLLCVGCWYAASSRRFKD